MMMIWILNILSESNVLIIAVINLRQRVYPAKYVLD